MSSYRTAIYPTQPTASKTTFIGSLSTAIVPPIFATNSVSIDATVVTTHPSTYVAAISKAHPFSK